jgi:intein/homing endonuclease
MARRWTKEEEEMYRAELVRLYVDENKSIREVGLLLGIKENTVFDRLKRLHIPTSPERNKGYLNQRKDLILPERSVKLAEFFGIMLGDGHTGVTQTFVTLGTKEENYVHYVQALMSELFGIQAKIVTKQSGYHDVYIGSVEICRWLKSEGLVSNKVASQVDVPEWIFETPAYMRAFIRGFFDTDGSIYRLRHGVQISITNHSLPLLVALQKMLRRLGYAVSEISAGRIYITRRPEILRFFTEIKPQNSKHQIRFEEFMRRW